MLYLRRGPRKTGNPQHLVVDSCADPERIDVVSCIEFGKRNTGYMAEMFGTRKSLCMV